jgi:hypothetical protein
MMNPRFPGVLRSHTDFGDVRTKLRTLPFYVDVDLTTARTLNSSTNPPLVLPINANVLYVDQKSSSGVATVHFQDDANAGVTPITVQPGFIAKIGYTRLIVENTAQPGLTMRFIYGVDLDFLPAGLFGTVSVAGVVSITGSVTVTGTVSTQEQGAQYGAAYTSGTNITANGTSQVFAAAANVNGATIHSVLGWSQSASAPGLLLLAKATAPTAATDGDLISAAVSAAAGAVTLQPLTSPVRIAAGKGLWFFSSVLETSANRGVLYTLF